MIARVALLLLGLAMALPLAAQAPGSGSPHGPLPEEMDCSGCHRIDGWTPALDVMAFDHDSTAFVLDGAHAGATCAQCHLDLRFDVPRAENLNCSSCHLDIHQGTFSNDCVACHNTVTFNEIPEVDAHAATSFPLTGAHGQAVCESCHSEFRPIDDAQLEQDCVACHLSEYQLADLDHEAQGFPVDCRQCHGDVAWNVGVALDHATLSGGFSLLGSHASVPCSGCHVQPGNALVFGHPDSEEDCLTCHVDDHAAEHGDGFPTDCMSCHTMDSWSEAAFDHAETADFALEGAHRRATCASCHVIPGYQNRFDATGAGDCAACHQQEYQENHQGSGFSDDCASCHSSESWDRNAFNHAEVADGYVLRESHLEVQCTACHAAADNAPLFQPADPDDCVACHISDYQSEHQADGFPQTCASCHTEVDWGDADLDHAALSDGFPLIGRHEALACTECHLPPPDNTPIFDVSDANDCVACHLDEYDREHQGSGFPTDCLSCHTADGWEGATVSHESLSGGFPLLGLHADLSCAACHLPPPDNSPIFQVSDAEDCVGCHSGDYEREHAGSGFPDECASCHTVNGWGGATIDHGAISNGFALVGAHDALTCAACHLPDNTPIFNPSSQDDCVTCHQNAYDQQHAGTGFSTDCATCHTVDSWEGATFDHASAANGFALVGAHDALTCLACHLPDNTPIFNPSSQDDCVTCHQNAYDQQHAGTGFSTDCATCHTVDSWEGATFDHASAANGFALVGAHDALTCLACHLPDNTPIFNPSSQNDCVTCHQNAYDQQHAGTGFSTDCATCHTVDSWEGATFDHASAANGFALVGAHDALTCSACHLPDNTPIFNPSSQDDCVTCHQNAYDQQHAGTGFSTDCATCHTVDTWGGATFDHDGQFFPIYSGAHNGEWANCQTCHIAPDDFRIFTCFACHEHNQSDTNEDHSEVNGYSYDSESCLSCHPNGKH